MKQQKAIINRRKYDEEFKREALRMIENGQAVRSVAQALGVAERQLHKWKRQFKQTRAVGDLEVAELTKKLRQVEMERDILKKALSIFSRQS
ncbi:MAG: transposase [Acidobacteriota bacterium]|nr:transposase [Acidobacteriota bacterium]